MRLGANEWHALDAGGAELDNVYWAKKRTAGNLVIN